MAEVERAECYARGAVDHGAKWALQVEDAMRLPEPRTLGPGSPSKGPSAVAL